MGESMALIRNLTKAKLDAGELVLGMSLRLVRGGEIAKIAAACDYDFLFIDMEHGALGIESVGAICTAALDAGCSPIVRAASHAAYHASRPLDAGAQGIVVPHVNSGAEAAAVVDHCRFPPLGHRSVAGGAPQLEYASVPMGEAIELLNSATLVVVMIETAAAVDAVDEIAAVPGVDVLLIGTNDLCADMGIPGQFDHDDVVTAYEKTIAACQKHGKHVGMGGVYTDLAERYVRMGVRMVLAGGDNTFLMAGARARSQFLRELTA